MKIIISESKLKSFINKFIVDQLGSYSRELHKFRRDLGFIGSFHNSEGEKMGEIHYNKFDNINRFDIDEDLYDMILKMFNIDDDYLIEIINEIYPKFNINEIVPVKFIY